LKKYFGITQAVLFYFLWYFSVLQLTSPGNDQVVLLVHFLFIALSSFFYLGQKSKFVSYVILIAIIGTIIDSIPTYFNFLQSPHTNLYLSIYPVWLIGMWACFAAAIPISFSWMSKKLFYQITFGAIGGPLSLFAASKIGAVVFPMPLYPTTIIYSIEWAVMVPLCFLIARKLTVTT
jgi:hypothetical protein